MIATVNTDTGEILNEIKDDPSRENQDFVMMYRRFIQQVADLGLEDTQALRVLLFLIRHMGVDNAIAVPMSLISDMLDLSRQTISTKIKYLSDNGWISIYKLGRQNVYCVNPDIVWTSYANQKKYAKFNATVMISSVDQWELSKKNQGKVKVIDKNLFKKLADGE